MAEQCLQPRRKTDAMIRGSAVHLFLEQWHKTQDPDIARKAAVKWINDHVKENEAYYFPEELEKIDQAKSLVIGICKALPQVYEKNRWKIVASELHLRAKVRDLQGPFSTYAGTIDAVIDSKAGYWILDYKTRSHIPPQLGDWLRIDSQSLGYNWLLRKALELGVVIDTLSDIRGTCLPDYILPKKPVLGVLHHTIVKTKIRQRQAETGKEFLDRLESVYVEDFDKHFQQTPALQTDEAVQEFEDDLYDEILDIQQGRRHRSTHSCMSIGFSCEYLPLCVEGFTRVNKQLYKKEAPNYWDPKLSLESELLEV